MLTSKQANIEQRQNDDAPALYGKLLAQKLRKLPSRARLILQNKIDNLVFEAELNHAGSSSAYVSPPASRYSWQASPISHVSTSSNTSHLSSQSSHSSLQPNPLQNNPQSLLQASPACDIQLPGSTVPFNTHTQVSQSNAQDYLLAPLSVITTTLPEGQGPHSALAQYFSNANDAVLEKNDEGTRSGM